MPRELTEAQRDVLGYLEGFDTDRDGCPSSPEIRDGLGRGVMRPVNTPLAALRARGLVERMGQSFTGAWCWKITPAGRAALEARHGD